MKTSLRAKRSNLIVEVGGTKTSMRLFDSFGAFVKEQVIPSDPRNLKIQIRNFLKKWIPAFAGMTKPQKMILGIRGVWTPAEKKCWLKDLKGLAPKIFIMSDIELAFNESFGTGPGIILNAGTGSIAFGRSASGKTARAGGVGPLLGDEGSAYWIGKEYLRGQNWEKLRGIAKSLNPVAEIAGFAKTVLAKASMGDKLCRAIVDVAQNELMILVAQVRRDLGGKPPTLRLVGGLFENQFFKKQFEKKLKAD